MRLIEAYQQVINYLEKNSPSRSFVFKFKLKKNDFEILKQDLDHFADYEEKDGSFITYLLGYEIEFVLKKPVPKSPVESYSGEDSENDIEGPEEN